MDADIEDRQRRIIADAIARGHTVARWVAALISLLFIASGLWWAGILVLAVTTFELPRRATQLYLRKRGVDLSIPSGQEVEKRSLSGLAFGVVFIPVVCALFLAENALGRHLLPWTWRAGFAGSDDHVLMPFVFVGLVVTISWFVRRRREARADDHAASQ
ncbi:hypothetical protein [Brevibacterium sp. SMBL_HHYL_HB1]|uniref:hypothetical protein n=1 Tax=Brevibacterium sp. SMBL_HHYL_HB1 TaxID=2777556 RepID=UPI001BA7D421|nr:hypothetical protein [Brevibacterium sp. SMBL_HHYL_HB1]QUL79972.1 hypothetical protein IG171_03810 [Brevibacterium sp. SMBL_HHYL_HB1]